MAKEVSCVNNLSAKQYKKLAKTTRRISKERMMIIAEQYRMCPHCTMEMVLKSEMETIKELVGGDVDQHVFSLMLRCFKEVFGGELHLIDAAPDPEVKVH